MEGRRTTRGTRSGWAIMVAVLLPVGCADVYQPTLSGECERGACDPADPADVPVVGDDAGADVVCASQTIPYTDTTVTLVIPVSARFMQVKAWGAGGNEEMVCAYEDAGMGGYTEAVFEIGSRPELSPGASLAVVVGQLGRSGLAGDEIARFGFGTWGGGGLSGVFVGTGAVGESDQARALVVAGGGGSAGGTCSPGGPGNHPTQAGGQSTMKGSVGADGPNGGGGGYAGGTGGASGQGGRGGSGYVSPLAARTPIIVYAEPGAGVPPGIGDPDHDGTSAGVESDGLVVIKFTCELPPLM